MREGPDRVCGGLGAELEQEPKGEFTGKLHFRQDKFFPNHICLQMDNSNYE